MENELLQSQETLRAGQTITKASTEEDERTLEEREEEKDKVNEIDAHKKGVDRRGFAGIVAPEDLFNENLSIIKEESTMNESKARAMRRSMNETKMLLSIAN